MTEQQKDAASKVIAVLMQLKFVRVRELGRVRKAFSVHWSRTIWHGNGPTEEEYEFLRTLFDAWPNPALFLDPAIDSDIEREVAKLPDVERRGDALVVRKNVFDDVIRKLYRGNWAMLFFPTGQTPGDIRWSGAFSGNATQNFLQESGAIAGIVSGPDDLDWRLFIGSGA